MPFAQRGISFVCQPSRGDLGGGSRPEAVRKGDRVGQHSIRINKQWRICFKWQNGDALDVEIVDYH